MQRLSWSGCTNEGGSGVQSSDEANGPSRTAAWWVLNACNHLLGSGQPRVLTAGAKGGFLSSPKLFMHTCCMGCRLGKAEPSMFCLGPIARSNRQLLYALRFAEQVSEARHCVGLCKQPPLAFVSFSSDQHPTQGWS